MLAMRKFLCYIQLRKVAIINISYWRINYGKEDDCEKGSRSEGS